MSGDNERGDGKPQTKEAERAERLAAALRANLRRRKEQARSRAGEPGKADEDK